MNVVWQCVRFCQRMVAQPLEAAAGDRRGSATGGEPTFAGAKANDQDAPKRSGPLGHDHPSRLKFLASPGQDGTNLRMQLGNLLV
jgi:hypothetical protein